MTGEETPPVDSDASLEPGHAVSLDKVRKLLFDGESTRFSAYRQRLSQLFDLERGQVDLLIDVAGRYHDPRWQPGAIPGVTRISVTPGPRFDRASAALIRMEPGVVFPTHLHGGPEWGLIMQGQLTRVQDNDTRHYRAGDLVVTDADTRHSIVSDGDEPLLWLLASYGEMELADRER